MATVNMVFDRDAEAPFNGSPGTVNVYVRDCLRDLGCEVNYFFGPLVAPNDDVPLRIIEKVEQLRSMPAADLQLWCDMGLGLAPLRHRPPQKNIVFFHRFTGFPGHWIGNEAIDKYWGNSVYTQKVLQSIVSMPDWRRRRILDPRAFEAVSSMTLALPCIEEPAGAPTLGAAGLSHQALAAIDSGDFLGYCMASKCDERATYTILLLLNKMSLESGDSRRFRLFIDDNVYNAVTGLLHTAYPDDFPPEFLSLKVTLDQLGLEIEDVLVPMPLLTQPALFELFKSCRFGLFYHRFPEPFGLLPLESVFHGCPVYTNGAGNIRHLLPPGCGLNVHETEEMVFGDLSAYAEVAQAIFRDVVEAPDAASAACRRGAEYIRKVYTRDAMRNDMAAMLADLEPPATQAGADFESLEIVLGPLVRSWNDSTRKVISDYKSLELSEDESSLVTALLGEPCSSVNGSEETLQRADKLFRAGVLALAPPSAAGGAPGPGPGR